MEDELSEKQNEPTIIVIRDAPSVPLSTNKAWAIPFNGIIPRDVGSAFLYIKNDGYVDLKLDSISVSSSVGGVLDAAVKVYQVSGVAAGVNLEPIKAVNKNSQYPNIRSAATILHATDIMDLESIGQLDRIDIALPFTRHEVVYSGVVIAPESAIALTWGVANGAVSGIINISE